MQSSSSRPRVIALVAALGVFGAITSCGARTALEADPYAADALADAPTDASPDADADAAIACIPGEIPLSRAYPSVVFVVDRSTSMNARFGSGTRWSVLSEGLRATLPPVDRTIAIGALVFPSAGGGGESCVAPTALDLAPATSNVEPFLTALAARGPSGSTPTADAIEAAASSLASLRTATTAKALVLATDGAPGCNASLDPATCRCIQGTRCNRPERCLDDERTIATIARAAARDIPTYVVGIQDADEVEYSEVLDAMAAAGGKARPLGTRKYYAATSRAELEAAFVAIRTQVGECTFLSTSVPSADGTIVVTLDGAVVPFDAAGTRGWRWSSRENGEIVLTAEFCSAVRDGVPFTATVTCGPPDAGDAGEDGAVDASEDGAVDASEGADVDPDAE